MHLKQITEISTVEDFVNRRKKLHKLGQISPRFSREIGDKFEKYVQMFLSRTSSDFKTPKSFSTSLGVWKSEKVLLLVFELLLKNQFSVVFRHLFALRQLTHTDV